MHEVLFLFCDLRWAKAKYLAGWTDEFEDEDEDDDDDNDGKLCDLLAIISYTRIW